MKNNYFLIDMDNFFPSCEIVDRNLDENLPIIVSSNSNRSVVSSCSVGAKKKGVKSGMPVFEVKKICPEAIYIPPNFKLYESMAYKIEDILLTYTKNLKKISTDEWLLDFSDTKKIYYENELAEFIKAKIYNKLKLKSSIGIGNNFFNAKTASYFAKPFGVFTIDKENFEAVVWKIPIEEMYMVGKQTSKILKNLGIENIGQLANYKDRNQLFQLLGKNANTLLAYGLNLSEHINSFARKNSMSSGQTFLDIKFDYDNIIHSMKLHFNTIHRKLTIEDKLTKTVAIAVKTEYGEKRKQFSFNFHTNNREILWNKLINIFEENWDNQGVKSISVSFDNIIDQFRNIVPNNLFEKPKQLDIASKVNHKLGYKAVWYAKSSKR